MIHRTAVLLAVLTLALPAAAGDRTVPELLDAMLDAQLERAEGVSDYTMDVTLMGQSSTQYYERSQIETAGGRSLETFRLVPPDEVQRRLKGEPGFSSATASSAPGGAAGLPPGMLGGMATGETDIDSLTRFAENAQVSLQESIDGGDHYLVKAEDLNVTQMAEGREFVIQSVTMWVDAEDLLVLKTRMDGVIKQDGQIREMFIERLDRDHRNVVGSRMILPYTTVLRMDGLLGPQEQREMEEARQNLAEIERQLASMPPEQRRMTETTMGPQIETLRTMARDGVFEIQTTVREIRINEGISGAHVHAAGNVPGGESADMAMGMGQMFELAGGFMSAGGEGGFAAPAVPVQPEQSAESLQQAREACLRQKIAEAETKKKKKKRFGKFLGAVSGIAGRHGGSGFASDVSQVTSDVYAATATAQDLEDAAEALGITQDDIAACENPE